MSLRPWRRREILADGVELYLGDCLEVVPTLALPDDIGVCSDPPYGIGAHVPEPRPRSTSLSGGRRASAATDRYGHGPVAIAGDDEPFDPAPWLRFPCVLWGANHFSSRLPHGRWLAWNKLGTKEPWDSFSDVEFAWQNLRAKDVIFSLLWKGLVREGDEERVGAAAGKKQHPAEKPVPLMRWCLGFMPQAAILDPYMGSGSTGIAAVQLGRRFIGVEIDERHFDTACRRVGRAVATL